MFRSSYLFDWPSGRSRQGAILGLNAIVWVIGLFDYLTGWQVSWSPFYAYPIALAAWYIGSPWAYGLSLLSVVLYTAGDLAAGFQFDSWWIPVWNAVSRLVFYALVIELLAYVRSLTLGLELRVLERTSDLRREIAERERLERELLDVGERERRRLGFDLHDGLCQHLTGTALISQVVTERLRLENHGEAERAQRLVNLVEEAIVLARGMAKGLYPVELRADGLMQALEEFAVNTSELFGIDCRFVCHSPVLVPDWPTAIHLYRIAQEGVSNAIKHGRASEVTILLEEAEKELRLAISDNGGGIVPAAKSDGLGLRIMADRAKMVGGSFKVGPARPRGTELVCLVPQAAAHG